MSGVREEERRRAKSEEKGSKKAISPSKKLEVEVLREGKSGF